GSGRPPATQFGRGRSDGAAAGGAAHRNHPEGVPRNDLSGDCRHARVSVEHGEDTSLPGIDRASAAPGEERTDDAATGETIMSETFSCGDHGALVSYLYDECTPTESRAIAAHAAICRACAIELRSLGATREHLATWTPPEVQLGFRVVSNTAPSDT